MVYILSFLQTPEFLFRILCFVIADSIDLVVPVRAQGDKPVGMLPTLLPYISRFEVRTKNIQHPWGEDAVSKGEVLYIKLIYNILRGL